MLLHGLTQDPTAWQDVISGLATAGAASKFFAPWVQGTSPRDHDTFDIDRAASDVARLIELQAGGRAAVCGLSLGAAVAIQTAAEYPELVSRLVVSGAIAKMTPAENRAMRFGSALMPAARFPGSSTKAAVREVYRQLRHLDLTAQLGRITCPTLVLCGQQDTPRLAPARELVAAIPDARLVMLPGGHSLNREQPSEFVAAVAEFLADAPAA